MDWGLILVITAVAFLVGHLALDLRTLGRNLERLSHDGDAHRGTGAGSTKCERCHTLIRSRSELRHESIWTAAAVIVLAIHITLDFVA